MDFDPTFGTPDWISYAIWAGYVASAVVAVASFFDGFRKWFGSHIWQPIRRKVPLPNDIRKEIAAKMSAEVKAAQDQLGKAIQASSDAIRSEIKSLADMMHTGFSRLNVVEGTQRVMADSDMNTGHFRCDETGGNTWTNQTLLRWLHCSQRNMEGFEWVNMVHPDERADVQAKWAAAQTQHRTFSETVRMGGIERDDRGQRVWRAYEVVAEPIPDAPPPVGWVGWCRPVEAAQE